METKMFALEGRTALITGGAGVIGGTLAETLGGLGARIAVHDLEPTRVDTQITTLKAAGIEAIGAPGDLESEAETDAVVNKVLTDFGGLDILINNAAFVGTSGLSGWNEPFERQSLESWNRAVRVNMTAVFQLTQRAAPALRQSGHGSVINIASIYGLVGPDPALYEDLPMHNPAAYNASKGGLVQLTRWLSTMMAPKVRVNAIAPGGLWRGQPEAFVTRYEARTPMGRLGKPEDLAGAVAFLASEASAYVTGVTLPVDGGWTAW